MMWMLVTVFGVIGGYLPIILGSDGLSVWSVIGSTIGGIVGIAVAYKISN